VEDTDTFDDGQALWTAVCEHELEGVVAKRRSGRYVPGGRAWITTLAQPRFFSWFMPRRIVQPSSAS